MEKAVIVFRFGKEQPLPADRLVAMFCMSKSLTIDEALEGGSVDDIDIPKVMHKQGGFNFPGGIISMFMTERKPEEITELYRRIGEMFDDTLPCTASYYDHTSVSFTKAFEGVANNIEKFFSRNNISSKEGVEQEQVVEVTMTLDELLDVVSRVGIKGLTPKQKERLDVLSRGN